MRAIAQVDALVNVRSPSHTTVLRCDKTRAQEGVRLKQKTYSLHCFWTPTTKNREEKTFSFKIDLSTWVVSFFLFDFFENYNSHSS